jgi:ABC-type antimicrobial peptide transport system, ATPase component
MTPSLRIALRFLTPRKRVCCGKSTLLYILGLLDPSDAVRASIESAPMLHLSDDELARKRNEFIGFIFQFCPAKMNGARIPH